MPYSDLITQKEAAAILNRSVLAVSRAIKDGRIEYADSKIGFCIGQGWRSVLRKRQGRGLISRNAKRK